MQSNNQQLIKYKGPMLASQKNKDVIEQIKKLNSRIQNLSQTKVRLFDFLIKTQQMFTHQSKSIKNQIEIFEDAITKKSFYSVSKCQSMKKLVYHYKHFITFIENVSKLNEVELKKIDIASAKLQERLKKKNQSFMKVLNQYSYSQQGYNKNFSDYQYICGKLDQMMGKFKSFEDPINFYNLHMANDFSKSLQKKYHQCQNKQTSLISLLQLLDEKRKSLSENLKDIKQDYVVLLHFHMTNIVHACNCLTDSSKDDIHQMPSSMTFLRTQGDVFNDEIQKINKKYGKGPQMEQQQYSDFKELFLSNNSSAEITTDDRLFLDRCENFIQKKYESVQQFLYLQKRFIEEIGNQTYNCQKINKQFITIQKNMFRSNGTDDFKKRIRKYFGEGVLNMTDLCFIVTDVPRRRYEKIGKMFLSHDQKLKKILKRKQDELSKFKKRINLILSQHTNATKALQNNTVSANQFKSNIQKTFAIFKTLLDEFNKNQMQMDKQFEEVIKKIVMYVESQSSHCLLKYTLNKQKEKFVYNIFRKFNSDTQIVEIVKQDTRYQILFNDTLKPCLFNQFRSQIEKKKFQQTRKVLQKKQNQARGMIGEKQIGCCGMQTNQIKKYTTITSHNATLITKSDDKVGKLDILNKGLTFQQKKRTPFGQKIQIAIPTKQIVSFNSKILEDGRTAVQIFTGMGPICFASNQTGQIMQSLDKNIGTKIVNKQQTDSKRDKSNDTSSFLKQNNTSTQYKISFEKSILAPQKTSNNKGGRNSNNQANQDSLLMKKLIQGWKASLIFSEAFALQSTQESGGSIRTDYKYKDDLNKFLLKEKKNAKVEAMKNYLFLTYQWKISFPDMPMLKSFTHAEQIRIQINKQIVKIIIIQKNRGESHLFIKKTFYTQIDKMNKKLSDLIVQICQRQGQVIIEQQRIDSQQQSLVLDLQNLALDKEEVQSKHENKFGQRKQFSGSMAVESQKGSKFNSTDN